MKGLFKAYLALGVVCFFWGTTYLAIRIAVEDIPPFLFSGIRQIVAGGLMVAFFMLKSAKFPKPKEFVTLGISGFLLIVVGNGLVAWAEKYVSSGLAAIICSLVPVWIIILNIAGKDRERVNLLIVAGIILGFLGLILIFHDNLKDFADTRYTYGIVAIFLANLGWALGTIITKKFKTELNPLFASGWQIFLGGIGLALISLVGEDYSSVNFSFNATMALIYLIFFGSILAFGCYGYALSKLPAGLVAIYAYINPFVAVFLGYLILNEKLNSTIAVASVITLLGVYLVNEGYKTRQGSLKVKWPLFNDQ